MVLVGVKMQSSPTFYFTFNAIWGYNSYRSRITKNKKWPITGHVMSVYGRGLVTFFLHWLFCMIVCWCFVVFQSACACVEDNDCGRGEICTVRDDYQAPFGTPRNTCKCKWLQYISVCRSAPLDLNYYTKITYIISQIWRVVPVL